MKKLYFYPCPGKKGYGNPYCKNYKSALTKYYDVLNPSNKPVLLPTLSLFRNSFSADIYVFNWLEDVGHTHLPLLQYILVRISLLVLILRRVPIIWMFHNILPHHGESFYSSSIRKVLFKRSKLIISHSEEGAVFAKNKTNNKVLYICHPVEVKGYELKQTNRDCDVLIWGDIFPYKGVVEFLENYVEKKLNYKILILGKAKSDYLNTEISKYRSETISFENRRAEYSEIAALCKNSRYVLFPYVGNSMSSSGALIDTIVMGGNPVGPAKGAFNDLKKDGVCFTYDSYDDLYKLLGYNYEIREADRSKFVANHTWDNFADTFINNVNSKV